MTSDAKIGLLLGLVFIFVIAFIINGLPNLRPQTTRGEATTVMNPTEENIGIADKAQKAEETLKWTDLLVQQEPEQSAAKATAAEESKQVAEAPQTANNQDIRSVLPSIGSILERFATGMQKDQTSTISLDVPKPATEQPPVAQTQPPKPVETIMKSADAGGASTPARPTSASSAAGLKVYVVGEGESLASVAKKVYGPEEGNRVANIKRIYEANKDILKSPDEVAAGQKLIIPPALPPLNPKPEDVLSKALFEKVDTISRQAAAKVPPKTTAQEGRWYVVQDGDNLWKIATNQLGSGARCEEIAKLNADILKSKETLDVGMRIRLPAK
jgi:nucleoid-associated protein YgaU